MMRELNLLPTERRRLLKMQTSLRTVRKLVQTIVFSFLIVTLSGVAVSGVFWVLLLSSSQTNSVNLEQALEKYKGERERVARSNLTLKTMVELSEDRVVWSELLPDLFDAMPPGVIIDNIEGKAGKTVQISISGRAANRSVLALAETRLRELSWVSAVNAPRSNLIDRLNPKFSFTLLLSDSEEDTL